MERVIELDSAEDLDASAYGAVVHRGALIGVTEAALTRVAASRRAFLAHLDTGVICYGVTTGLGAMSTLDLSAGQRAALPRHTVLGRASGTGTPLPAGVGRGALLAKLVQFLDGRSAVTPELCVALAAVLNAGLDPAVPGHGYGMAGEILPLAHAVQPLIGEGFAFASDGTVQPAATWLAEHGLAAYEPQPKEGLSLISGTGVGPALAWHLGFAATEVLGTANLVAAASIEGIAAPLQPYGERAAALNPDPHVAAVAAVLRRHLAGSRVTRQARQAPVSYRVTPQVHAVAVAAVDALRDAAMADIRANGDNPSFFASDEPPFGELIPSGNFHGARLASCVEAATVSIVHVGNLAEKRLYRLLDERASGLSRQLAAEPGLDAGLITVHKAAAAYGASLRMLAAPVSVVQTESSFGQEDVTSMVFPALERLDGAIRLTHVLLAHEAFVATVAIDERGGSVGHDVAALHARIREHVPPYTGDRPYGPDLDRLIELL